jgi:hypothetical protein
MAEKRMFTKKITDDDNFITLSSSAQALYFHLNQGADDDGFNNQVQMAMFKAHASIDDLKVLMAKNYIIRFDSGVIVIKHWRMHNTLRKDRYKPTNFLEELRMLGIKENGAYTLGCQTVAERLPQDSIVKDSIVKDNNIKEPPKRFTKPTLEEVQAYCKERNNGVDARKWYNHYEAVGWKVGRNPMKDWKASVRTWERNDNSGANKQNNKPMFDYDQFTE